MYVITAPAVIGDSSSGRARMTAEAAKLNEWYFRIDRVLRNLELCQDQPELKDVTAGATEVAPAVAQVSAGLREIATGAFA